MTIELPRPLAFVLTGGASNGAVQAGMLRALQEVGVVPDLVAGTSVGALNGAVVAEDPDLGAARLLGIWRELETQDVFTDGLITRLRNLVGARRYLYSGRGLRKFAAGHLRATTFQDLRLPFVAVATDVLSGHPVELRSGSLIDAVAASAAIPGVLPNVAIDGRLLMDGGVVANAPMEAAIAMGAQSVVVLDAGYACDLPEPPSHAAARILHATSVMIRRQVERHVHDAAERVPVVALPALCPVRSSPLDFSRSGELIDQAYEASRGFLADLDEVGVGLHGHIRQLPDALTRPQFWPGLHPWRAGRAQFGRGGQLDLNMGQGCTRGVQGGLDLGEVGGSISIWVRGALVACRAGPMWARGAARSQFGSGVHSWRAGRAQCGRGGAARSQFGSGVHSWRVGRAQSRQR